MDVECFFDQTKLEIGGVTQNPSKDLMSSSISTERRYFDMR